MIRLKRRKRNKMYIARVIEDMSTRSGCWNFQKIGVFKKIDYKQDIITVLKSKKEEKVGEYIRDYSSFMRTFWAFQQNGLWYALYSKNYLATSVMSLPDCKWICGEEEDSPGGFCPVDFYVPEKSKGMWGFVAGCIWGDDWSTKIEYLDLSMISKGFIKRDNRFGYIILPENQNLCDAIDVEVEDFEEDKNGNRINEEYMISINIRESFREDGNCYRFNTFKKLKRKK
jgi:hypothetical protein